MSVKQLRGLKSSSPENLREELSKKEKRTNRLSLIAAHGGPENIVDVNACITRLRIDAGQIISG